MQSSTVEQFSRAGVRAGGLRNTGTEMGTPKASENNMTIAREGVFGGLASRGKESGPYPKGQQRDFDGL